MRIHSQSPIAYTGKEDGEIVTPIDRHHHTALNTTCPRCGAKPSSKCDGLNTPLSVHMERQEASL